MASHLTAIAFLALFLLFAAIIAIFLYIAGSIAAWAFFYLKGSIQKSGRPPMAGSMFDVLLYFDTFFDFQTTLARRHRTFRLSHNEIFTTDPANIEHILKTNFSKYVKGEPHSSVLMDLLGEGIFAVDGEKWQHQRKLASYEFSTRILRGYSSVVFRSNAAKLAMKIAGSASTGAVIDMQELFMKSTLDSIFKVGFGVELDTLSGSEDVGTRFSKAFDNANWITCRRYFDMFWRLKRRLNIGLEAKLKEDIKLIDDFVFQLIRRKREQMKNWIEENDKEDILSRFIVASKEDPEHITDRYLRDIILNFLIAGKDTTANTLTWFFYLLCKNPIVQEKIVCEINDAVTSEGQSVDIIDFASQLTQPVLDKMHYFHAALTETLRIYPAVPSDGKTAEEDDVLPDGFKVKKGDGVSYMPYAMGRMTYLWGEDAEEFRPERWLQNGTFQPESTFKFITFNAGPRICLGKDFAYKQMKILAAVLLHFFKFKLEDESKTAAYRTMLTLHIDKGLPLIASCR
nr:cytochrome P450 [Paris polyphylla]